MKKILISICLLASITTNAQNTFPTSGSAGIGTATPNASSVLDMISTTKGMLTPRMTKIQRDAIATPATGLLIYQTNSTPGFYYYSGTAWTALKTVAGWGLKGNANTNSGVNFIGTTDTASFIIKTNNQLSGLLSSGNSNTSYGYQNLISNTNYNNTAVGYNALKLNTTGGNNTALGTNSLINNTVGYQNTAVGSNTLQSNQNGNFNSAFGYGALLNSTTGVSNTAVGNNALFNNTTGNYNTGLGINSLYSNSIGESNIAIGVSSLYSNTSGSSNIALGINALTFNSSGNWNIAMGQAALQGNTTADYNIGIGYYALATNSSGTNNTAIGNQALRYNTANNNTAVGSDALYSNSTGDKNSAFGTRALSTNTTGVNNVAIGYLSMFSNASGVYNTAVGYEALKYNTTGNQNTATGLQALWSNTTGDNNTATGNYALSFNTTGYSNSAFGFSALNQNSLGYENTSMGFQSSNANTTASRNVAVGTRALYSQYFNNGGVPYVGNNVAIGVEALYSNQPTVNIINFEGVSNTAVGNYAMFSNTYGFGNTSIGKNSLYNNIGGIWNTAVGLLADVSTGNLSNATTIGQNSVVNASGKVRIGSTGVSVIEGQVAYSYPSDARFKNNIKENVPGLDFINKLQPITYTFDTKKFDKHLMQNMPDSIQEQRMRGQDYTASSNIIHSGFLAQDIEKICNELGYDFDGLHIADPKNPTDNYSVAYSQFVPSLVKAVQEVDKENSDLKTKISSLEKTIQQMQECLNVLCENNDKTNNAKNENSLQIQIAPNPTNGIAYITISGNEKMQSLTIKIIDSAGKLIRSFNATSSQTTIEFNTESFSKGTYAVQLLNQNEILKTEKLIVN